MAKTGSPVMKAKANRMIDGPPVPAPAQYLLSWFWDLWSSRSGGGGMSSPYLTQGDILAWRLNTRTNLQPWEYRALRAMADAAGGQSDRKATEVLREIEEEVEAWT